MRNIITAILFTFYFVKLSLNQKISLTYKECRMCLQRSDNLKEIEEDVRNLSIAAEELMITMKHVNGVTERTNELLVETQRIANNLITENNETFSILNDKVNENGLNTKTLTDAMDALSQQMIRIEEGLQKQIPDNNSSGILLNNLEMKLINLEIPTQNMTETLERMRHPLVGFTAYIGREITNTHEDKLLFGKVVSNIGGHFNLSNSTFRCPESGMYYFHSTICSQKTKHARATIVKNSVNGGLVHMYAEDKNNYDCGSNGVILEAVEGDRVWVCSNGDSFFDPQSYFSGALISRN